MLLLAVTVANSMLLGAYDYETGHEFNTLNVIIDWLNKVCTLFYLLDIVCFIWAYGFFFASRKN